MKFKHTLNVLIDNFAVVYKQLLYRLVITVLFCIIYIAIITPFVNKLTGSPDFNSLVHGVRDFVNNLVHGENLKLAETTKQIQHAISDLKNLLVQNRANIIWGVVGIYLIHFVQEFLNGLGNYATAAVINDKMALRANSPFFVSLIKNLKPACLYSICYVPLSMLYNLACLSLFYFIVFKLFAIIPLFYLPLQLFLFITLIIFALGIKMAFTTDWLPAFIRGKKSAKDSFVYTFDRRGKKTFNVLSNFVILILLIFTFNVIGIVFTFGAGGLITIPSSYVILICFEFVNYYDREELKYFIDKHTIIKPENEKALTREEFFRGE